MDDLFGFETAKHFTVTEINRYIRDKFQRDSTLSSLWIQGEISNFRPHYSGHLYFTLKDSTGTLKCVMFKSAATRMRFRLENGMRVLAYGNISVFERDGVYQLYCEQITQEGLGDLYTAFEQLKRRLEAEGLFTDARKKPLPQIPGAVCVVTSPTGSVIKDIFNVALRRFPNATIRVVPVQVQGTSAAGQIADAIDRINVGSWGDLIIVARGGGSLEDLWAFNEEVVARAISRSQIPVVSAVGHETDFTICDFVADLRAPTPSAAAELAFPDISSLCEKVQYYDGILRSALKHTLTHKKYQLERCTRSAVFTKPLRRVEEEQMRLAGLESRLLTAMKQSAGQREAQLALMCGKLDSLSPLAVLARGYALATAEQDGRVVRRTEDVATGERIYVRLQEGQLHCEVL